MTHGSSRPSNLRRTSLHYETWNANASEWAKRILVGSSEQLMASTNIVEKAVARVTAGARTGRSSGHSARPRNSKTAKAFDRFRTREEKRQKLWSLLRSSGPARKPLAGQQALKLSAVIDPFPREEAIATLTSFVVLPQHRQHRKHQNGYLVNQGDSGHVF